jgi:hypothetical protein
MGIRTGISTLPRTCPPTSRGRSRMMPFKKCRQSIKWALQGSTQTPSNTLMTCTSRQPHLHQGCQPSMRIKRRQASREVGSQIIILGTQIRLLCKMIAACKKLALIKGLHRLRSELVGIAPIMNIQGHCTICPAARARSCNSRTPLGSLTRQSSTKIYSTTLVVPKTL